MLRDAFGGASLDCTWLLLCAQTIEVYERRRDVVEDRQYAICLISLGTLMQEEGK